MNSWFKNIIGDKHYYFKLNLSDSNELDKSLDEINLTSVSSRGSYLVLAGEPLHEQVVRHGPFVTNSEADMKKAILDFQDGKMGRLW